MTNPFAAVTRRKKTTEAALQKFGKGLKSKYDTAQKKWQESPRYQKALKNARNEGAA